MKVEELYEFIGVHAQGRAGVGAPMGAPVIVGGLARGGQAGSTIRADNCARLFPWQQLIVNQLRTGQDIYTIVSPGGGKTSPVVCYWIHEILKINTLRIHNDNEMREHIERLLFGTRNLQKLVYLVPTRQLAQQTINDLREQLSNIIAQLLNWYFSNFNTNKDIKYHFFKLFIPWINRHYRNIPRGLFGNNDEIDQLMSDIRDSMKTSNINQSITGHRNNMLRTFQQVIEEAVSNFLTSDFLYIQTGGQSTSGNPSNFPIIVAIYQSANKNPLLNAISSNSTKLIVCDESHLTQNIDPLHHPQIDKNQAEDIALSLYTILNQKSTNTQLAFLSGTQNPKSAINFANYISQEFRNIRFDVSKIKTQGERNRAQIEVVPDNSLTNNTNVINKIVQQVQSNSWGNLYILFSTKTMKLLVEESIKKISPRNLSSIDRETKHGMNFNSYLDQRSERDRQYQNYGDMKFNPNNIARSNMEDSSGNMISPEARNIKNPFLRIAVSHGIGFISRNLPGEGRDPKVELEESDKFIIAQLFSQQKLKVLLATDAVGIGVNIKARNLYIPRIEKFSGTTKKVEEIILRDLSQILNRVGRSAVEIAAIHTPEDNIQKVTLSINADPDQFETSQIVKNLKGRNAMLYTYGHLHSLHDRFDNWLGAIRTNLGNIGRPIVNPVNVPNQPLPNRAIPLP